MMEHWSSLSGRYDAMSLRERVLVGIGVVVVTVYMSYFLLVDPLVTAKPRLALAVKQERAMIKAVEAMLVPRAGQSADDDAVKRAYQDALLKQIDELSQSLKGMQAGLVPPDQMGKLLEGMIVQVRGIEIVSLRKLPVQRMLAAGKPAVAPAANAASGAVKPMPAAVPAAGSVYQHGFQITVQGSYAGLHEYLARLEKLPWRMFWGEFRLDAERHPDLSLTLTVHTLSLDRTWLTI